MPSVHREPGGSTLADLEAMPGNDGRRYELIDGNIIVSPWPAHYGGISFHLGPILAHAVPAEHASYRLCGLDLPGEQRVIPDLMVAPHTSIGDQRLRLPVLLVVEILCGLESRDLILKRTAYASAGVPAYWLIDPGRVDDHLPAARGRRIHDLRRGRGRRRRLALPSQRGRGRREPPRA